MTLLGKLGLIERNVLGEAYYISRYDSLKKLKFEEICVYYIAYKKIGEQLEKKLIQKKCLKDTYLKNGQTRVKDTMDIQLVTLRYKEIPETEDLIPNGLSNFWENVLSDLQKELDTDYYTENLLMDSYAVLENLLYIIDLVLYNKNSPYFVLRKRTLTYIKETYAKEEMRYVKCY